VFNSSTTWVKLGGGVVAAALLTFAGWQVATWRSRALEADRLEALNANLAAAMAAAVDARRAADQARVEDAAAGDQREAELEARIRDLQEGLDLKPRPECDFPPEVAGTLNRAMGHDR
jgi:hypothetical protein